MRALVLAALLCAVSVLAAAAQNPGPANGHGQPSTIGGIPLPISTVAGLPACIAAHRGMLLVVTDVSSSSYGITLVGGGTVVTLALCNGTTWTQR